MLLNAQSRGHGRVGRSLHDVGGHGVAVQDVHCTLQQIKAAVWESTFAELTYTGTLCRTLLTWLQESSKVNKQP